MKYQAISFYTPDYEEVALRLGVSCQKNNVPLKLYPKPPKGSWVGNCGMKPQVIREAWFEFETPIVWIDADAVVRSEPVLFNNLEGYDFAAHWRVYNNNRERELLSGTLWFGQTEAAKELIERWCEQQEKCQTHWDQHTLRYVLMGMPSLKIYELPASYTQIFDSMAHNGKPVIEHFQESRKHKKCAQST